MQSQELNFSLHIPLALNRLILAERFTRQEIIEDIGKSSSDRIKVVYFESNKISEELSLFCHLKTFLQKPVQELTNSSQVKFVSNEKVFFSDASMIGSYHSPSFPGLNIFMKRTIENSGQNSDNEIDVLSETVPIFENINDKLNRKLEKLLGLSSFEDWPNKFKGPMTNIRFSYIINSNYENANYFIFQAIQYTIRSFLIYFYKSLILFDSKIKDSMDKNEVIENFRVLFSTKEKLKERNNQIDYFTLIPISDYAILKSHTNFQAGISSLQEVYQNQVKVSSFESKIIKEGKVLKRGEGPFDFNWNDRYLVLDQNYLTYYKSEEKSDPRGRFLISKAIVGNICGFDGKEFAMKIEWLEESRTIWLSSENPADLNDWKCKIMHLSLKIFDQKDLEYFIKKSELKKESHDFVEEEDQFKNSITKRDTFHESGVEFFDKEKVENTIFGEIKPHQSKWEFYKVKNRVKLFTLPTQFYIHNSLMNYSEKFRLYAPLIIIPLGLLIILFFSFGKIIFALYLIISGNVLIRFRKSLKSTKHSSNLFLKAEFLVKKPVKSVMDFAVNLKNLIKWNQAFHSVSIKSANKFEASLNKYKNILGNVQGQMNISTNSFLITYQNVSESYQIHEFYVIKEIQNLPDSCLLTCITKIKTNEIKSTKKQILKDLENQTYSLVKINEYLAASVSVNRVSRLNENIHPDENGTLFIRGKPFLETKPEEFDESIQLIRRMANGMMQRSSTVGNFEKMLSSFEKGNEEIDESEIDLNRQLFCNYFDHLSKTKSDSLRKMIFPASNSDKFCFFSKIAEAFAYMPIYLDLARDVVDPVEKIKFVVCFVVAGIENIKITRNVPLLPYPGETFQAFMSNGNTIDFEQIDENKTAFFIKDVKKSYIIHGVIKFKIHFLSNFIEIDIIGDVIVEFGSNQLFSKRKQSKYEFSFANSLNNSHQNNDSVSETIDLLSQTNEIITIKYPSLLVSGLIVGKQKIIPNKTCVIEFSKKNLLAIVDFSNSADFQLNTRLKISGQVISTIDRKELFTISGFFPNTLIFSEICYWKNEIISPSKILSANRLLPSDSTLREDLYNLNKGKKRTAGFMKIQVAQKQQIISLIRKNKKS